MFFGYYSTWTILLLCHTDHRLVLLLVVTKDVKYGSCGNYCSQFLIVCKRISGQWFEQVVRHHHIGTHPQYWRWCTNKLINTRCQPSVKYWCNPLPQLIKHVELISLPKLVALPSNTVLSWWLELNTSVNAGLTWQIRCSTASYQSGYAIQMFPRMII